MPFPTYPYGYQPQYYPQPDQLAQLRQQQMQQPVMQGPQMMQQPQPMPPQNNGINWVSSKQEADDYPISPGFAVALWDKTSPADKPVIYLRQTDGTGRPITITYDLVQRHDNAAPPAPAPQIDPSNIVTWDKLDEYLAERLKRPAKGPKQKEDTDNG